MEPGGFASRPVWLFQLASEEEVGALRNDRVLQFRAYPSMEETEESLGLVLESQFSRIVGFFITVGCLLPSLK